MVDFLSRSHYHLHSVPLYNVGYEALLRCKIVAELYRCLFVCTAHTTKKALTYAFLASFSRLYQYCSAICALTRASTPWNIVEPNMLLLYEFFAPWIQGFKRLRVLSWRASCPRRTINDIHFQNCKKLQAVRLTRVQCSFATYFAKLQTPSASQCRFHLFSSPVHPKCVDAVCEKVRKAVTFFIYYKFQLWW